LTDRPGNLCNRSAVPQCGPICRRPGPSPRLPPEEPPRQTPGQYQDWKQIRSTWIQNVDELGPSTSCADTRPAQNCTQGRIRPEIIIFSLRRPWAQAKPHQRYTQRSPLYYASDVRSASAMTSYYWEAAQVLTVLTVPHRSGQRTRTPQS
jgi:hypothetical protein